MEKENKEVEQEKKQVNIKRRWKWVVIGTIVAIISLVIIIPISCTISKSTVMTKIEKRLCSLALDGEINFKKEDEEDLEGWTYEINEEIVKFGAGDKPLDGEVITAYTIEGQHYYYPKTYILEFESEIDAKRAMKALQDFEDYWYITRESTVLLVGEKDIINLILDKDYSYDKDLERIYNCENCHTREEVKRYDFEDGEIRTYCTECYMEYVTDNIFGELFG